MDPITVLPPKVRAAIYLALIVISAVLTPLMAAGIVPSLYGTIILSLMAVFGGTTALANVRKVETRPEYRGEHETSTA